MEFTSPQARERYEAVVAAASGTVVGLDFDGVLSPIVDDPEQAHIHPDAAAVLAEPCGHWHDYGKSPREGRKVGHATLRADSPAELADALERVGRALGREAQVGPVIARLRG